MHYSITYLVAIAMPMQILLRSETIVVHEYSLQNSGAKNLGIKFYIRIKPTHFAECRYIYIITYSTQNVTVSHNRGQLIESVTDASLKEINIAYNYMEVVYVYVC